MLLVFRSYFHIFQTKMKVVRSFPCFKAVPPDASSCRIVAVQYLGPLPVEAWRSDVTEADLTYIRSRKGIGDDSTTTESGDVTCLHHS